MAAATEHGWDLPSPFILPVRAQAGDLDVFGHVNNAVYPRWFGEASWAHWNAEGFDEASCAADRRGMAVIRAEIDYLAPARAGDALLVGVWITASDGRLRAARRFEVLRPADGRVLARGLWRLVCFHLDTGRPARMTAPFIAHYRVKDQVRAALAQAGAPEVS